VRPIPLNLMTLYADLLQSLTLDDEPAGSIAIKTVKKRKYAYVTTKDGRVRVERYLGLADDPNVQHQIARVRRAAELAKSRKNTVSLLKRGRFPSPSLPLGRILEVIANAGLFKRGMTLVGTAAYQAYAGVLGHYAPAAALMTNDADLSIAEFVPDEKEEDIEQILKRADSTFAPVWQADDKLPKVFRSSNGFAVDFLTRSTRGGRTPVLVKSLGLAATPLSFQEFLVEETIETVALYGSGVLVRVPTPLRYSVHKLIVAQRRQSRATAKKLKDLRQAQELLDILLQIDEDAVQDMLDEARDRGAAWRSAINASLKELGREARQGRLPVPLLGNKVRPIAASQGRARRRGR